jgi:hypothetical protein
MSKHSRSVLDRLEAEARENDAFNDEGYVVITSSLHPHSDGVLQE